MRERGILKSENKFYLSLPHDEKDVTETLAAFEESMTATAGEAVVECHRPCTAEGGCPSTSRRPNK